MCSNNYIPEIWNFGNVMVLVWTPPHPPPPHAKACVSRNCDTNARIKFVFDTAIDTLEWKNPIDFGENRKTKMAAKRPFCQNMMKKLVHTIEVGPYLFWQKSGSKMAAGGHFEKKKLRIDLKYREKRSKVIFGHPKRPFCTKFQKNKSCVFSPLLATISHFSPLFPTFGTFSHFSLLFTTFTTFPHFSPLFTT